MESTSFTPSGVVLNAVAGAVATAAAAAAGAGTLRKFTPVKVEPCTAWMSAGLALTTAGLLRGSGNNWQDTGPFVAMAAGVVLLLVWAALQRRPHARTRAAMYNCPKSTMLCDFGRSCT